MKHTYKEYLEENNADSKHERSFGLDVVRVIATFFIIGIHFFLNNGFYAVPLTDGRMFLSENCRWIFFCCVPLFMMLTGYLKCEKLWTKSYYKSLLSILLSWLLISVLCMLFKIIYYGETKSVWAWVAEILNFKAANYSWYIEMYIGLLILSPFLNMIFAKAGNKRKRILLLASMLVLTSLPPMVNIIAIGEENLQLLPDFWVNLYPLTYYFIGCYIKRYQPVIKKWILGLLLVTVVSIKTCINFLTAGGGTFGTGITGGYAELGVVIVTVLIFLLLYRIETRSSITKKIFSFLSAISLEIYLISWIFDKLLYEKCAYLLAAPNYYISMFFFCPIIFAGAACAALPIQRISKWMSKKIIFYVKNIISKCQVNLDWML